MVSDPGSKLDFDTFIAYLLPGYILAFLLFCIGDSITILTSNHSLIYRIGTWLDFIHITQQKRAFE